MPEYTQFVLSKTVSGIWQGDFNTFQKGEYRHAARFENIKIEGALFTGILHYENGNAENFLMIFVERTTNDKKELGVAIRQIIPVPDKSIIDKAFLKKTL